jgi:hypothetical protein
VSDVPATVRTWTPGTGGSAYRDDGSVLELPPECLQHSVFRFLRAGQRVRLQVVDGLVKAVTLP